jgi:predicted TPR repeat methyltransferase
MPTLRSKIDFDEKAGTWDSDPVKFARAYAVAEAIRNYVPISARSTGFEFGCGTGLLSFALLPYNKHIILADISAGMLAVLREV